MHDDDLHHFLQSVESQFYIVLIGYLQPLYLVILNAYFYPADEPPVCNTTVCDPCPNGKTPTPTPPDCLCQCKGGGEGNAYVYI